jgi:hypothetical protein
MIKIPSARILDYITNNLTYDPDTGIIKKDGKKFGALRPDKRINIRLCIGFTDDGCSMIYTTYAHQVAWYLSTKTWPDKMVDHINCDPTDNRICNLRLATRSQNAHNRGKQITISSSQYKGVHKVNNRWRATIMNDGIGHHLGYYDTEEDAAKAYDLASQDLHGEFGKSNL